MKYYIYRNNTIEMLFGSEDTGYSGYDDISCVPEADSYIWFYQVPFKLNYTDLANEINGYTKRIQLILQQIPKNKPFIIFSLTSLYPLHYTNTDFRVSDAITDFNSNIRELAELYRNIKLVDFSEFTSRFNAEQLVDWKFYFISQAVINPKLAVSFRKWFLRKMEEVQLKRKKCIVLDLDNTLWGGILGEDGIDGIKIGGEYPGKAFLYFQEALIELSKNGVLLTICSKNNDNDVFEVWEKNPFILLKREYISAYRINWQNKADNIKELAQELNIGLDSFVFIDDNPTERELVKQMLPMVEVPDFPEKPYQLPVFFKSLVDNYFCIYTITDEDKRKIEQYKANAERNNELKKYADYDEYLESLEIQLTIEKANNFNIVRIAQMTQKTNQFNLTTRRYTDSEIQEAIDKEWLIYCVSIRDKFGDNGITGVIMLEPHSGCMRIDSFLLSCRILGKGIEHAFICSIINKLIEERGIRQIKSSYLPTKKNMQVADFYEKCGFDLVSMDADGNKEYNLDILKEMDVKSYYKVEFV